MWICAHRRLTMQVDNNNNNIDGNITWNASLCVIENQMPCVCVWIDYGAQFSLRVDRSKTLPYRFVAPINEWDNVTSSPAAAAQWIFCFFFFSFWMANGCWERSTVTLCETGERSGKAKHRFVVATTTMAAPVNFQSNLCQFSKTTEKEMTINFGQ